MDLSKWINLSNQKEKKKGAVVCNVACHNFSQILQKWEFCALSTTFIIEKKKSLAITKYVGNEYNFH